MKKSFFILLAIITVIIIVSIMVIHNMGIKEAHVSDPRDKKMGIWH